MWRFVQVSWPLMETLMSTTVVLGTWNAPYEKNISLNLMLVMLLRHGTQERPDMNSHRDPWELAFFTHQS